MENAITVLKFCSKKRIKKEKLNTLEKEYQKKKSEKMNPTQLYKILKEKVKTKEWWPVDKKYHTKNDTEPRFEIIVGAILTQITSWKNVEKALENLKTSHLLSIKNLNEVDEKKLKKEIKPSGFFNQKAKRLKNITNHIQSRYNSDLDNFFNRNLETIREELLKLKGVGKETADSILLYAGEKPVFVVDTYTKRLCERIPIKTEKSYEKIRKRFETNISENYTKENLPKIYNQLHALIVSIGKKHCKKKPKCESCPINEKCNF